MPIHSFIFRVQVPTHGKKGEHRDVTGFYQRKKRGK